MFGEINGLARGENRFVHVLDDDLVNMYEREQGRQARRINPENHYPPSEIEEGFSLLNELRDELKKRGIKAATMEQWEDAKNKHLESLKQDKNIN